MANSWFQFKQFKIEQERCALKVGTDACILGAWAQAPAPKRVLDIGTGTGLLALMLAQRYATSIDALEPEPEAASQAEENFKNSPWQERLQLYRLPVQEYATPHGYDLLVCNPPFYPNHLKSANATRNIALHQQSLTFNDLAQACSRLLTPKGICYILLPPQQAQQLAEIAAKHQLFVQKTLLIRDRPSLPYHRSVYAYSHALVPHIQESTLCIRNEDHRYSAEFKALLQDYYLIF